MPARLKALMPSRRSRECRCPAIASNPERHPPVADLPSVQRIRLKQFPFSLLYIDRADDIWVVAVAHGSRKPGYWKGRIL